MVSRVQTKNDIKDYLDKIKKLRVAIDAADAVIVGAGAGLSTSAGFTYNGERFTKYFSDFEKRYGFHDMYSGGFYSYRTPEEFWAYWSIYLYQPLYERSETYI